MVVVVALERVVCQHHVCYISSALFTTNHPSSLVRLSLHSWTQMSQSQTQKEPSQGIAVKVPTNARPRVVFTPVFSQPAFMANPQAAQAIASTRQVFTAVDTKLTAISTKLAAETKLVRNEIADMSQLQHEELAEVKRELQSRRTSALCTLFLES